MPTVNSAPMRLPDTLKEAIRLDDRGLIPAVIRSADDGEILMVAWMNEDALAETLASGTLCYWSRSRGRLWRKGEVSGQSQRLVRLFLDCDGDTLLIDVEQTGVACHTGRRSCFFRHLDDTTHEIVTIGPVLTEPEILYGSNE